MNKILCSLCTAVSRGLRNGCIQARNNAIKHLALCNNAARILSKFGYQTNAISTIDNINDYDFTYCKFVYLCSAMKRSIVCERSHSVRTKISIISEKQYNLLSN